MLPKSSYYIGPLNKRETSSLEDVFREYYSPLCSFAEGIILNHQASEDIVEEAFIKLWKKNPNFDQHKNIKAALYISVKNACLDYLRKSRNNKSGTKQLEYLKGKESEDFILNEIVRAEVLREIHEEMQRLPQECRKVMNLYFVEGFDYPTIAATLGISEGTVRNHKSRGIRMLRQKLGSSYVLFMLLYL